MFSVFINNVNKTSSDARNTAPSSCAANNDADIDIVTGIAAAVPVFSAFAFLGIDIIMSISALILSVLIIMRTKAVPKKVKPKSAVLN